MSARDWAREHPWTLCGAAALAVAAVAAIALWARAADVRDRVGRLRGDVERMERIADECRELRAVAAPPKTRGQPLTLGAVERVARERRVAEALTDRSAAPVRGSDGTVEQTIKVSVAGVTPGALSSFLYGVEQMDPAVRVRELRIAASRKQPGTVDASVVIAAHETPPTK